MTVNINTDDYAASDIKTWWFPGGEPGIEVPIYKDEFVNIRANIRTWNDYGMLLQLISALCGQQERGNLTGLNLWMPYWPGARQDRNGEGRFPLTGAINAQALSGAFDWEDYGSIHVLDIHSQLAFDQLSYSFWGDTVQNVESWTIAHGDKEWLPNDITGIIIPDKGARERCEQWRDHVYPAVHLVQCEKKREFGSSKIVGFEMEPLPGPGKYLIVDDICDGGWTFNCLADAFFEDPNHVGSTLELFVSHGIFSKGVDNISTGISRIYTTDSFCKVPFVIPRSDDELNRLRVITLPPVGQGES